ncbi:MAG: hypothetical protein ACR2OC_03540 [Solirubrobacterales bacterium]
MNAGDREFMRELNESNRELMRELNVGNREFMRELTLRHERATDGAVNTLGRLQDEIRANTQVLLEVHAESRAQRDGVLKLIDRIDELGRGGQG